MEPSKMDKRTKEYKEWAAQQASASQAPILTASEMNAEHDEHMGAVLGGGDEIEKLKAENERLKQEVAKSKLSGRPPTKPWDRHDGKFRPHRPNRFLVKPKSPEIDREWRTYFSHPDKVESRLAMDYEVAPKRDYIFTGGMVGDDGGSESGPIMKGGLVLMRKRRELFDQEQAYKEEMRKRQRKLNKLDAVKKEAAAIGESDSFIDFEKE
jgi:hypothetical protein